MTQQWYVAKTKPNKETIVARHLTTFGVEAYYPVIRNVTSTRGKLEGLFPTYIFCRLDPTTPTWSRVRWTSGLSYFLGPNERPTAVPDDLIDYLKERTYRWNNQPPVELEKGMRIAVSGGPFAGLEGIFQRYTAARERCRILLETLGGPMAVELPRGQLRRAAKFAPLGA